MNIKTLSQLCGVSTCTISRVLNGRAEEFRISAATADRVFKAAKKAGYRPNYLAQSLNIRKTYTIGLVFANSVDAFLGQIMEGVEATLRDTEYQLAVATCEDSLKVQKQELNRMIYRQVDGIILYPLALPARKKTYRPKLPPSKAHNKTPFVIIGRQISEERDLVMFEDFQGGQRAAESFLKAGCKQFTLLTLADSCSANHGRKRGFLETLQNQGVPAEAMRVVEVALEPTNDQYALLKCAESIFAVNSGILLRSLPGLGERCDLHAKRYASVGSFEGQWGLQLDLDVFHVPARDMGEKAAKKLLWRIDHPDDPYQTVKIPLGT